MARELPGLLLALAAVMAWCSGTPLEPLEPLAAEDVCATDDTSLLQALQLAGKHDTAQARASCDTGSCCPGTISKSDFNFVFKTDNPQFPDLSGRCKKQGDGCSRPCGTPFLKSNVWCKADEVCLCQSSGNKCVGFPQFATTDGFYAIAHMTGQPATVQWAIGMGANAIEFDIQYHGTNPVKIQHSNGLLEPCDCTCYFGMSTDFNVCKHLGGPHDNACLAGTGIKEFLNHVASTPLTLAYFDNKVSSEWSEEDMKVAGANLAGFAVQELFKAGFRGKALIGVPTWQHQHFLKAAISVIDASPYASRVFFTTDAEGSQAAQTTINNLRTILPGNRIIYSTGISACAPFSNFVTQIHDAALARQSGEVQEVFIWSLDKEDSMRDYMRAGATGILSNRPGYAPQIASKEFGRKLYTNSPV